MKDPFERHLTPSEIAVALGVSRTRGYQLVKNEIPHLKFGQSVRVSESAFRAWLEARTVKPLDTGAPREVSAPRVVVIGAPRKPKKIGVPRRAPMPLDPDRPRIRLTRQPT